jgi:predicted transcriptional regulator of viral defense system
MKNENKNLQQDETTGLPEIFRPRDLIGSGIPRTRIRSLLDRKKIEKVGRGLYRIRAIPPTEYATIAMVSKRVPGAIICLLTALHVHNIGTQAPREVWIALDRKARKPDLKDFLIRVVRFSGVMLQYGLQVKKVQGVNIRITSPSRTVVDCFRYRRKIGLDVALEALKDVIYSQKATFDEIMETAKICRVGTIIKPYLESMA